MWRNPKPSSTSYCSPLRFIYRKESKEVVLAEYESIMASIKNITLSIVSVLLENGTLKEVEVQHVVNLTIIDGKIQTIISTGTNSYRCCFSVWCISNRNKQSVFSSSKKKFEGNIRHGVSTLHAWIKFLECMLHISYKMQITKWQAKTEDKENIVKLRKVEVRSEFRKRMSLVIDQTRVGGAGTLNDGNPS